MMLWFLKETGLPQVREKSGGKYVFKVREKSGNFDRGQGISMKSGKML